ncbi:MAG: hypothetical protein SGPRY_004967 [Prymnesium sp.]
MPSAQPSCVPEQTRHADALGSQPHASPAHQDNSAVTTTSSSKIQVTIDEGLSTLHPTHPTRQLTRHSSAWSASLEMPAETHQWVLSLEEEAIFVLSLYALACTSAVVMVLRMAFSDGWSALFAVLLTSTSLYVTVYLFGAYHQRWSRKARRAHLTEEESETERLSWRSLFEFRQAVAVPLILDHPINLLIHVLISNVIPVLCELIETATTGDEGRWNGLEVVSIFRLALFIAFSPAIAMLNRNLVVPHHFAFAISKLTLLFFTCHVMACAFWGLARNNDFDETTWVGAHMPNLELESKPKQYLLSLYWATVTASTVGYGDLSPVGDGEVILTIIFVIGNIWLLAGIVGGISALASMEDTDMAEQRRDIRRFEEARRCFACMLQIERISDDVVVATREYLRLSLHHVKANIDSLPLSVRQNIREQRFGDALSTMPLTLGLSRRFVAQCVGRVSEDFFVAGLTILRPFDIANRLCIILEGTAGLYTGKSDKLDDMHSHHSYAHSTQHEKGEMVAVLHPGSYFGAEGFMCFVRTPWAISARTMLRVITLDDQDRRELERAFPHDWSKLMRNLLASSKELCTAAAELVQRCETRSPGKTKLNVLRMSLGDALSISPQTASQFSHDAHEVHDDIARYESRTMESLSALVCHLSGTGDEQEVIRLLELIPIEEIPSDYDGRTGLHLAAAGGHINCLLALLRYKANKDAVDRFGRTPLQEAVLNARDEAAQVLLKHGATLGLSEGQLASKLCDAAHANDCALIRRYLDAGADPNVKDYDKRTCLMLAAASGSYGICKLLIDRNAQLDAEDRWGHTALDEARYNGHTGAICEMLSKAP